MTTPGLCSRLLTLVYNGNPYTPCTAQEDTDPATPLTEQQKAKGRDIDLLNHKNICSGFVYACYHMCCMPRTFTLELTSSVLLMLGMFYMNLGYSFIKVFYEMTSTTRSYPRFMHAVELVVNLWIHHNYSIFSRFMKVGREEVKHRHDGQMHVGTKQKVLLVAESLYSCLHNLIMFSIVTTLTRVDANGVSGVSILCAAMLKLLHWSLIIPEGFQARHYILFPSLATFERWNVHAVIHGVIALLAVVMSMFVLDHKSSHTVLFWVTVVFVFNQFKMWRAACYYSHTPNRTNAQDENVAVSTAVTQIYALILILRLDAIETGLVHFYDELRDTYLLNL